MSFFDHPREQRTILPAKLTIGRPSPGDGSPYVTLQIKDVRSGARFVEARISYADFTAALMGLSEMEIEVAVAGLAVVGMRQEQKTETVRIPQDEFEHDTRHVAAMRYAETFEIDGWRYSGPRDKSWSWSQGQWTTEGRQAIVRLPFIRHVPYTETPDGPATEPDRPSGAPPANPAVRHRRRKPDAP